MRTSRVTFVRTFSRLWVSWTALAGTVAFLALSGMGFVRALMRGDGVLYALLQPNEEMKKLEKDGDVSARLAYTQEFKAAPFALVWDYYCAKNGKGVGLEWVDDIRKYEKDVLSKRQ